MQFTNEQRTKLREPIRILKTVAELLSFFLENPESSIAEGETVLDNETGKATVLDDAIMGIRSVADSLDEL
jgi:hypothetical protein